MRSLLPLLLLVLSGACSGRLAYRQDESVHKSFDLPADVKTVRVDLHQGALTFTAGAAGKLVLEAAVRRAADTEAGLALLRAIDSAPRVVRDEPGVLTLLGPRVPGHLDHLGHRLIFKARIDVPAGVAVVGKTGWGHVAAVGRRAPVTLETAQGDVRLDACHGDTSVRTGLGIVMVSGHRGGLDAWSHECSTMQVFVEEIGAAGVKLVADKGSVQAHVPRDAAFTLDARTWQGRAANAFGIAVAPLEGHDDGLSMRGPVAGGGPPVTIESHVGNVSIGRTAP